MPLFASSTPPPTPARQAHHAVHAIKTSRAAHGATTTIAQALTERKVQNPSQYGTLIYRARSDGSAYSVINRARGIYTKLPNGGDSVGRGDVLYRVNDHPVLVLCGSTPAYRSLSKGASGPDVTELNADLVDLGYATHAQLDPTSDRFSAATESALERLQSKPDEDQTGSLDLGQAVFLPGPGDEEGYR